MIFFIIDELLGNLLCPLVSLAVALILFEGGLSLRLADIRQTGHVVRNSVTVGALATWILANQKLVIFTVDSKLNPQPGDTLISLVEPVEANEE